MTPDASTRPRPPFSLTAGILPVALAVAAMMAMSLLPAAAAAQEEPVVVGTRVVPPFVIQEEDGSYHGLTVGLWEHIAGELGLEYTFREMDIEGMLAGVEENTLFAAASALTITSEREDRVDFTHPFFVTGLGIAVPREPVGLGGALVAFLDPELWWVVLLLMGLLLFWGVLVWVFERVENQEEFGGSPVQGIGSGFWWAAVTMTTVGYGDKAPRTVGGRVVGFIWMFSAIIVISFFTASIASSLTVSQIETRVGGPADLPHVRVGALAQSATVEYLDAELIRSETFPTIAEGMQALADGRLDAFVHDAPILRYYAQQEFRDTAHVLPVTFAEQYYGIALPMGHPDRNRMNQVLLDYLASSEWEQLNQRYLGRD